MSSIEEQKTADAIANDLLTPPTPSASVEAGVTTYLLRVADQNVLEGAREWTISKGSLEFTLHVNNGWVVGTTNPSHKWMLGKSWAARVKPWLISKQFNGVPVVPVPVKKARKSRAKPKGA